MEKCDIWEFSESIDIELKILTDNIKFRLERIGEMVNKNEEWLRQTSTDTYTLIFDEHVIASSFVVTIYNILEYELNNFCDFIRVEHGVQFKYTDIWGKGIFRAQNYLSKVEELDEDIFKNKHWKKIKKWNMLRNLIVHEDAIPDPKEAEKINRMLDELNVKFVDGKYWTSFENCREFNKTVQKFFAKMILLSSDEDI